jgi:hypothetical protein
MRLVTLLVVGWALALCALGCPDPGVACDADDDCATTEHCDADGFCAEGPAPDEDAGAADPDGGGPGGDAGSDAGAVDGGLADAGLDGGRDGGPADAGYDAGLGTISLSIAPASILVGETVVVSWAAVGGSGCVMRGLVTPGPDAGVPDAGPAATWTDGEPLALPAAVPASGSASFAPRTDLTVELTCDGPTGPLVATSEVQVLCGPGPTTWQGDASVTDGDSILALAGVRCITGNLAITGDVGAGDLADLFIVAGEVSLTGAGVTSVAGLPSLRTVGADLRLESLSDATIGGFGALESVGGAVRLLTNLGRLNATGLGALAEIGGDFEISQAGSTSSGAATSLGNLRALRRVGGSLILRDSRTTGDVTLVVDALESIGGRLDIASNVADVDITFGADLEVGELIRLYSNDATVDLDFGGGALRALGGIDIALDSGASTLHGLAELRTIGGAGLAVASIPTDGAVRIEGQGGALVVTGPLSLANSGGTVELAGFSRVDALVGFEVPTSPGFVSLDLQDADLVVGGDFVAENLTTSATNGYAGRFDVLGPAATVTVDGDWRLGATSQPVTWNLGGTAVHIGGDMEIDGLNAVSTVRSSFDIIGAPSSFTLAGQLRLTGSNSPARFELDGADVSLGSVLVSAWNVNTYTRAEVVIDVPAGSLSTGDFRVENSSGKVDLDLTGATVSLDALELSGNTFSSTYGYFGHFITTAPASLTAPGGLLIEGTNYDVTLALEGAAVSLGDVTLQNNPDRDLQTTIELTGAPTSFVVENVDVAGNTAALQPAALAGMTSCASFRWQGGGNAGALDLAGLSAIDTGDLTFSGSGLSAVTLTALGSVAGNLLLENNAALATFDAPALTSVGGTDMTVTNNGVLRQCDVQALHDALSDPKPTLTASGNDEVTTCP